MTNIDIKRQALKACLTIISERIDRLQAELNQIQKAASEETKSSAGDKYETGRAMLMLEKEKLGSQLEEGLKIRQTLEMIDPVKPNTQAEFGALVETKDVFYFLSVAIGKLEVERKTVFAISMVSPLGKTLAGMRAGQNEKFMDKTIEVVSIT